MKTTLESRKIELVQHFLNLDNIETISKIENLLHDEQVRISEEKLIKKITEKQIHEMLNHAENDFKNGETYKSEEINSIIDNWK